MANFYWDKPKKGEEKHIPLIIGIILLLVAIFSLTQTFSFNSAIETKVTEARIANALPEISVIKLTTDCTDCFDIEEAVNGIKSKTNITSEKSVSYISQEGKELISQFEITKLPTVIITGELNKSKSLFSDLQKIGTIKENNFVFTNQNPPFVDSQTGERKGAVSVIILENDNCDVCVDLDPIIEELIRSGVFVRSQIKEQFNTVKGSEIVTKYNISEVPALILDKELSVYDEIVENWDQIGTIETDGTYVIRTQSNPHYSINDARIVGLVTLTILTDETCDECYEPREFHRPVLQRMGVYVDKEEIIDIGSVKGKELIAKYNITQIPTTVLQGDMREYDTLVRAWSTVGTAEEDGAYVFRRVDVARQPYKDLVTNTVIDPGAVS